MATTIWSDDFRSNVASFATRLRSAAASISPALSTTRPVRAGSSCARPGKAATRNKIRAAASLPAGHDPVLDGSAARSGLIAARPYPSFPKFTSGTSILSSATVKFWNGSASVNHSHAQTIDGKVRSDVL